MEDNDTEMLFFIAFCLPVVSFAAYPFDYSERECRDMFPERLGHDAEHRSGNVAPYIIEPTDTMYMNQPIKVFIKSRGDQIIQGLFIQTRVGDCDARGQKEPIGHFDVDKSDDFVYLVNCSNKEHSAATNKFWGKKRKMVTVLWTPPTHETRKLYFVATIVADSKTFWTDIYSETIRSAGDRTPDTKERCPSRHKYKPMGQKNNSSVTISKTHVLIVLCAMMIRLIKS